MSLSTLATAEEDWVNNGFEVPSLKRNNERLTVLMASSFSQAVASIMAELALGFDHFCFAYLQSSHQPCISTQDLKITLFVWGCGCQFILHRPFVLYGVT